MTIISAEIETGTSVRILPPFAQTYPETYTVTDIVTNEDGSRAYILGEIGGFDALYLVPA